MTSGQFCTLAMFFIEATQIRCLLWPQFHSEIIVCMKRRRRRGKVTEVKTFLPVQANVWFIQGFSATLSISVNSLLKFESHYFVLSVYCVNSIFQIVSALVFCWYWEYNSKVLRHGLQKIYCDLFPQKYFQLHHVFDILDLYFSNVWFFLNMKG